MISPQMSQKEIQVLKAHLSQSTSYLEFGAGYSTILCSESQTIQAAVSVDSCREWFETITESSITIRKAITSERLRFRYVDIGPTSHWGYPLDRSRIIQWPEYSQIPWIPDAGFDLVFVDGRFRVACALKAALSNPGTFSILIHDYPNREHYSVVEEFLERESDNDTLSSFSKRKDINLERLRSVISDYELSPS